MQKFPDQPKFDRQLKFEYLCSTEVIQLFMLRQFMYFITIIGVELKLFFPLKVTEIWSVHLNMINPKPCYGIVLGTANAE